MGLGKQVTPEFKREAVQLFDLGSRPASEIARELGIARNQFYKWQTEFRAQGAGAFPGSGARKERTTEMARLKRELARVTEERTFLMSRSVLCQRISVKCRFVLTHQPEFRLAAMCRALQISRSRFCAWQRRTPSLRTQTNQRLIAHMRLLHHQTWKAYGTRKMWQLLKREGLACGRHRVARLRRQAGMVTLRRGCYVRTV